MNKPIHHGRTSRYQEVYSIEFDSRPGIIYTVALSYKGTWSCGCPRWTRNAERPECKHIKFMKSYVANAREAAVDPGDARKSFEGFVTLCRHRVGLAMMKTRFDLSTDWLTVEASDGDRRAKRNYLHSWQDRIEKAKRTGHAIRPREKVYFL